MPTLAWIITSGIAMMLLGLVGSLVLLFRESVQTRLIRPLVALSAGSLLGGAFFHMIPAALEQTGPSLVPFIWVMAGFAVFFMLEQFLHWHHCQRADAHCRQPVTLLILIGDGLHNLIGGLAVGGTFLIDTRLGVMTWLAAAAHEIPQELGDFGALVHGGFTKRKALALNVLSASSFLVGGLMAYAASTTVDVTFLVPFAAGNFIYIGAADLVPQINRHERVSANLAHFLAFSVGAGLLLLTRVLLE